MILEIRGGVKRGDQKDAKVPLWMPKYRELWEKHMVEHALIMIKSWEIMG